MPIFKFTSILFHRVFNPTILLLFVKCFAIICLWYNIHKNIKDSFRNHPEYKNIAIYMIIQLSLLPIITTFLFQSAPYVFVSVLAYTFFTFLNGICTSFMIFLLNALALIVSKAIITGWLLITSLIYALGIMPKVHGVRGWVFIIFSTALLMLVDCLMKTYLLKRLPHKTKDIMNVEAEHINASFQQSNNTILSMYVLYVYLIIIVVCTD